jgi:hypothetical protein
MALLGAFTVEANLDRHGLHQLLTTGERGVHRRPGATVVPEWFTTTWLIGVISRLGASVIATDPGGPEHDARRHEDRWW